MGNCCYKEPINTISIIGPMGNIEETDSDSENDSDIYINRLEHQNQDFNENNNQNQNQNQNQNNNQNNYGTYLDENTEPNIEPNLTLEENEPTTIWSFSGEQCIICMDNPIQGAILNCGHLKFCVRCLHSMAENADETKEYLNYCPVCRERIKGFSTFSPNFYYKY